MEDRLKTDEPTGAATTQATIAVGGMHCQSCVLLIEERLGEQPAVSRATVDLDAGRATVTYLPAATTVEQLCTIIEGVGYTAAPLP